VIGLLIDTAALDAILDQDSLRGTLVGAVILDASGNDIYHRNADIRMMPASNQKILTCAYAMAELGPERTIKTRFWVSGGRLIVDAPGDPLITAQQLLDAKAKLKFKGKEVYVHQAFSCGYGPAWEWDDLAQTYAPEIHALTVDQGQFKLYASGGQVEKPRAAFGLTVQRGRTSGSVSVDFIPQRRLLTVNGTLPRSRTLLGEFSLPQPDRVAARLLGGELRAWNGAAPSSAPGYTITSRPIKRLIKDCLEPSDNQIAEHLFLMAAGASKPLPANEYSEASERAAAFFTSIGIAAGDVLPRDGSGLSRQNLVTPRALANVLYWTTKQAWAADYRTALASPGEGTMASRLKDRNFAGKTGTIYAVSSLSGLLWADDPTKLCVASLVMNHSSQPGSAMRVIQDRFFEACFSDQGQH
jgi:D-alanyl-D-alanine carboxypeptidase/D-alanyl-D-alanine-endopeptidase (penicillin-binding protein 4)